MNNKMILGLTLALTLATSAWAQTPNDLPGVTVERSSSAQAAPGQWQDGHRKGGHGNMHQRGQQGQHPSAGRHQGMAAGLLTKAEAQTFRDQLMASKDYNACKRVQTQQHATLLKRAKDKGVTFPAEPRKAGMCERMSDRGYFNRTK